MLHYTFFVVMRKHHYQGAKDACFALCSMQLVMGHDSKRLHGPGVGAEQMCIPSKAISKLDCSVGIGSLDANTKLTTAVGSSLGKSQCPPK